MAASSHIAPIARNTYAFIDNSMLPTLSHAAQGGSCWRNIPITLIDIGFRRTNDASLRYRLITTAPNSFGVRLWSVKLALPLLTLTLIGTLAVSQNAPEVHIKPTPPPNYTH